MQTNPSQAIIKRFFLALELLKANRIIKGKYPFAKEHDVDFRNFYKLEKDMSRDLFQVEWLATLVRKYKVNPRWLLLGEEPFFEQPFTEKIVRSMQNPCNGNIKEEQSAEE